MVYQTLVGDDCNGSVAVQKLGGDSVYPIGNTSGSARRGSSPRSGGRTHH
jgi:hypothetical protein